MSATPSRRSVSAGLAWAVPAVAVSTAAPAFAASACDLTSLPGGTATGSLNLYAYRFENIRYVGSDGYLGTVSWWTTVYRTDQDPAIQAQIAALGCDPASVTYVDNSNTPLSYTVDIVRNAGDTDDFRTMALNNADANNLDGTVERTIDPRGANGSANSGPEYEVGETTYQWVITYPTYSGVYDLNDDHRTYTTISAGDGGLSGRITNLLRLNGQTATFENEGDQIF